MSVYDGTSSRLISPMIDIIFKMLFTRKNSHHLILDLVNKVIMPPEPFVSVTILNPEIPKDYPKHRGIALDILVQTSSGERVLVEMQAQDHKWFRERAVYYASRTYGNQLQRGEFFGGVKATYCIFFLNFEDWPSINQDRYIFRFRYREDECRELFSDQVTIYYVELPESCR
jgi:predicted transposase/invertase (TIGR01784 family)